MNDIHARNLGYLSITELRIDPDPKGMTNGTMVLMFQHSLNPREIAMASYPMEDVYPELPLEVFLRFNSSYPEALHHTDEALKLARRLFDAA